MHHPATALNPHLVPSALFVQQAARGGYGDLLGASGLVGIAARALEGTTEGPWYAKAQGGFSTVLAGHKPPRNDLRCDMPYGYSGADFCIAYPFVEEEGRSFRGDFVCFGHADARFVAFARAWVPEAAAALTALAEHNAALAAQVAALTEERDRRQGTRGI